ncbi:HlyD family secretion protein [Oxalobacteraceae bacterium CAVE-383]|nr:HlyD family secretion protein [Oxalobacteraceae bacterium CAVE-383]
MTENTEEASDASVNETGRQNGGKDVEKNGERNRQEKPARQPDPAKKRRIKRILLIAGIVLLVLGILFFIRWWLTGRYLQSTNDAYLKADTVVVAPKVGGYVSKVYVADNQAVKAGQPLVALDARQYQAALDAARANIDSRQADIARANAQAAQQQSALLQARAQLAAAQSNAAHADIEVQRYAPLAASGADAPEHVAQLKNEQAQAHSSLQQAVAAVRSAEQQIVATAAQTRQAEAQLESARAGATQSNIDAQDTVISSAIDGSVGDKSVRVGQFVQPGTRMMSIVPVQAIYLVANFKETQVGLMRAGQPATIHVDALSGVDLHGRVESFAPGTGSQFALLPPENATGNFTKIVQRVPVRIAIDATRQTRDLLLPGLSVTVEVDTRGGKDEMQRIKREERQNSERIDNQDSGKSDERPH